MVLPLGDAPNPRAFPFVNYALIAANVAVYLFISLPLSATPVDPRDPVVRHYLEMMSHTLEGHPSLSEILQRTSAYEVFIFEHGFRPAHPDPAALFTSLFLHAGFVHLFGNMLMLWIYGDNVEHYLGRLRYLLAYLLTGAAATLFHMSFAGGSDLPLIGASGAISGVLGFYFRWFPHNKVRLFVFLFPFIMDVFVVPARMVLGFYLIADNLLPFLLTSNSGGGVAYGAHIGGFIAGMLGSWILDRREISRHDPDLAPATTADMANDSIAAALDSGHYLEAARLYFTLPVPQTRGALTAPQSLSLADWLARNGHAEAALVVYRRHLRDHHNGHGVAEAHLGAGLIQLQTLGQSVPAYQHFLDALDAHPSPTVATAARAGIAAIESQQKFRFGAEH